MVGDEVDHQRGHVLHVRVRTGQESVVDVLTLVYDIHVLLGQGHTLGVLGSVIDQEGNLHDQLGVVLGSREHIVAVGSVSTQTRCVTDVGNPDGVAISLSDLPSSCQALSLCFSGRHSTRP